MYINSVVVYWILLMGEYRSVVYDVLVHAVGRILGVFYASDVLLGYQDPEWLQGALNVLIGLFWNIGMASNVAKSKIMTFQMVEIR